MALHFVNFGGEEVWSARRIWGEPDFWHRIWDARARQEVVEGDVAVFAHGCVDDPTYVDKDGQPVSWDDSQQDILAHPEGKEMIGLGKTRKKGHR